MEKFHQDNSTPITTYNSRRIIRSLEAQEDATRTMSQKIADWMTKILGSINFLILNI